MRLRRPLARGGAGRLRPGVVLAATHERALEVVPIETLLAHAAEPNAEGAAPGE